MSSISEESETGDDDHLDDEFIVCNDEKVAHHHEEQSQSSASLTVHDCLGELNTFKEVRIAEISFSSFIVHSHTYMLHFLATNQQINSPMMHKHVCIMFSVSLHFEKSVNVLYE